MLVNMELIKTTLNIYKKTLWCRSKGVRSIVWFTCGTICGILICITLSRTCKYSLLPAQLQQQAGSTSIPSPHQLRTRVSILCWVMTSPEHHITHAIHIKYTWGKRCSKLIFISSKEDSKLPAVAITSQEGRDHLTNKTLRALHYIYDHYFNKFDWYLKADDDTYVVMENLRHFLSSKNTQHPVYYGQKFVLNWNHKVHTYCSGGAGYVLSKAALHIYHTQAPTSALCRSTYGVEDIELGDCLESIGVHLGDTIDEEGMGRFHALYPAAIIQGRVPQWYIQYDNNSKHMVGVESLSRYPISFHYMTPDMIHNMEYTLYYLKLHQSE